MNILNKLTIKHLKMNKKRTVVTIIGIILSTALMVGIGLLMSTLRENSIDMVIRDNGSAHVSFYNLSQHDIDFIKKTDDIKSYITSRSIGYATNQNEFLKIYETNQDYFNKIKLSEGSFPKNAQEIVISRNLTSIYKIGDTLELGVGSITSDEEKIEVINPTNKKYKVVGVVENDPYVKYEYSAFPIYTLNNNIKGDDSNIYITYKKMSDTYEITKSLTETLDIDKDNISINDELLALSGNSRYSNIMRTMMNALSIVLVILSIGCIIVIYNSFAISVMERKKQFGLLSSVGTTKIQIRKTVFFEAFIVGTIGIILGIGSAYLGIGIVLQIFNTLLPDIFGAPLKLVTYPIFIIIPIIFMVITVIVSSLLPARKASKITPIEAIRLNNDIKIKGKKVRTPRITKKLFGIEGEIALKNIKRNKGKYRITILSLFISIVLFISFSSYMKYMFAGVENYTDLPDYDAVIDLYKRKDDQEDKDKFASDVTKSKDVEESIYFTLYGLYTSTDLSDKALYNKKYYDLNEQSIKDIASYGQSASILEVDQDTYNKILKSMNKKETKPILYNAYQVTKYTSNTRKTYNLNKYSSKFDKKITLCETKYLTDEATGEEKTELDCQIEVTDYYITDKAFYGSSTFTETQGPVFIIPTGYFGDLSEFNDSFQNSMFLSIDNPTAFEKDLETIGSKYSIEYNYLNIEEEFKLMNNIVFCIKLLIYGFITLVTLIGVTSVFNTINTSIHLRRTEFAVLRSMGLSTRGFNKMLLYESIFFGLKSLLYALPVSIGVTFLLSSSFKSMTEFNNMIIPYDSILMSIVGVFVIIIITTIYATRKIRKENILEAIREENI